MARRDGSSWPGGTRRGGAGETALEALDPVGPEGRDRHGDEGVQAYRQDQVQFGAGLQQGFGEDDIGAGGQAAIGEADPPLPHHAVRFRAQVAVRSVVQGAFARRVEDVAGEVGAGRRSEGGQPGGIDASLAAQHLQLAQGRGVGRESSWRVLQGLRHRRVRGVQLAGQKPRLGPAGGFVIGGLPRQSWRRRDFQSGRRQSPPFCPIAGNEGHGRGVDRAIEPAEPLEEGPVAARRSPGESRSAQAARRQGDILQEARAKGDGVGIVVDPVQPQADIFGAREIDGAGPRQAEHGQIGDPGRGLARLQGGAGEIVGGENLAALDQRGDLVLAEGRGLDQGT